MRTAEEQAAKVRAENTIAANPQPGDIYYTSWGYDQTNVEFFEVVRRTAGTVTLRRIAARMENGRLWPMPGEWARDFLLDGNSGTERWLRAKDQGYSEKVARMQRPTKWETDPVPGAHLKIDRSRTAWPWVPSQGGVYETFAAGGMGH